MFADILVRAWSIGDIAVAIVVIAALVALVYIALHQFGVTIPEWVKQVAWVVVVAFVVILAIKIILSM